MRALIINQEETASHLLFKLFTCGKETADFRKLLSCTEC